MLDIDMQKVQEERRKNTYSSNNSSLFFIFFFVMTDMTNKMWPHSSRKTDRLSDRWKKRQTGRGRETDNVFQIFA